MTTKEREPRAAKPAFQVITSEPDSVFAWYRELFAYRSVLQVLAAKDFQVRYKRASLGLIWAVAVPLLQAIILTAVFSRVGRFGGEGYSYAVFVLAGFPAWSYFSSTILIATTSITDASNLAEKVWFPRAIASLVPVGANVISLAVSAVITIGAMAFLEGGAWRDLWIMLPATLLLLAFTAGLALVLSAGYVFFRDLRFIVQAVMLVLFYLTPVVYPATKFDGVLHQIIVLNPLSGIVQLFQAAAIDGPPLDATYVVISVGITVALLAAGSLLHSRFDRLFVDRL